MLLSRFNFDMEWRLVSTIGKCSQLCLGRPVLTAVFAERLDEDVGCQSCDLRLGLFWRAKKLCIHSVRIRDVQHGRFHSCFSSIVIVYLETCSFNDTSAWFTTLMPALGNEMCPVWPTIGVTVCT